MAWPWPESYMAACEVPKLPGAASSSSSSSAAAAAEVYACRRCGRRYSRRDTWRRHERFECGGRATVYCCPLCPSRSKYKRNMDVHIATLHGQAALRPPPPPPLPPPPPPQRPPPRPQAGFR